MKFYRVFKVIRDSRRVKNLRTDDRYIIEPAYQPFQIIKQGETAIMKPKWNLPAKYKLPNIINPIFEITKDIKKTRRMNQNYKEGFIKEMLRIMTKPKYKLLATSKRRFLQFIDKNVIWNDKQDEWM